MDLDLGCVASFLVLLEECHYGRAARRLHLTASALTKRIQRLETQVGSDLLLRGTSGVVGPTAAGIRFAQGAVALLEQARATTMAAHRAGLGHTVTMGVPGVAADFPHDMLIAIARELRGACPDVRLGLVGVPFAELSTSLFERRVDAVWTAMRSLHPQISSVPLVGMSRVGIVGRTHEFADAGSIDVETFAEEPMLFNGGVPPEWMAPWYLADVRPAREGRLVNIPAQDTGSVLSQVARGRAVAAMPAMMAAGLPPQLHIVRLSGAKPVALMATHRRQDRSEPVRALVAAMRTVARRLAPLIDSSLA